MLQLYTNVQRMKQPMCFNEWVNNFTLVSTVSFHIIDFINKDMLTYFISGKMLLQHIKKLIRCISLPIFTASVHHTCSVANQVWAHDVYLSCVTYLLCIMCVYCHQWAQQNCVQQCMCMPNFKSFTCSKCAGTHVFTHVWNW